MQEILRKTPISFAGEEAGLERFFKLEHWRVKVGDREDDRIIWIRGGFVLIVAITPEQKVVAIEELKQAAQEVLVGLPAGTVKKGETPVEAALRELKEETGYASTEDQCRAIGPFFNSPDKSTEKQWVVVVNGAEKVNSATPDESESIFAVRTLEAESAFKDITIGLHRLALYEANLR